MKFSATGPDIPNTLIEASLRGEVVFLVGAGASQQADFPSFKKLTERIYERLDIKAEPAERLSIKEGRYEECLGTLTRRLADPRLVYQAVAKELDAERAQPTKTHSTILRLSRDFEGRPIVVTTNFDTLFERALPSVAGESFAGAIIPAPGGPRFEGVVHLHGRLADAKLGLQQSDLILTSADYGDAYLRSGWAARFLYDLARIRTIVLVGYSASDAPVRYILNILEADRDRFPDLNEVYVLAHRGDNDLKTAHAVWDAIAVRPVIFDAPDNDFTMFWADMAKWADLSEQPRDWRTARLAAIVAKHPAELSDWERDQASWILSHEHAIEALSQTKVSKEWFAFVRERNLIKRDHFSEWAYGAWLAQHLADPNVFQEALKAIGLLGSNTADAIDRGLAVKNGPSLSSHLLKAWRLLTVVIRRRQHFDLFHAHLALQRIKAGTAANHDLADALRPLIPTLRLNAPWEFGQEDKESLSTHCQREFELNRDANHDELTRLLPVGSAYLIPMLQLATGAMVECLNIGHDAELTGPRYDRLSRNVPSIAEHDQNRHHRGLLHLTRLCAECWTRLHASAPDTAHAIATYWRYAGYGITTRLWLFTLHYRPLLSADICVDALLALTTEEFWDHRKEVMELLQDRTEGAVSEKIDALVAKIVCGPSLSDHIYDTDRPRILDAYRWPYLKALELGIGRLPDVGQEVFDEINSRTTGNKRSLNEQDYFWSWSYGLRRGPIGDPKPIAQAPTEKRIETATRLEKSDLFNQADAWRVYCGHDPVGALEALIANGYSEQYADRWRDAIWAIIAIDGESNAEHKGEELAARALAHLRDYAAQELASIASPIVDLLEHALNVGAAVEPSDWDLAWASATAQGDENLSDDEEGDIGYASLDRAIGSPTGRLARLLVNNLGEEWNNISAVERERTVRRLRIALNQEGRTGMLARAQLVEFIAWINASVPELLEDLVARIESASAEAAGLRAIVLGRSRSISPELLTKLRRVILIGIPEFRGSGVTAEIAAHRLIAYVRNDLTRADEDPARLAPGEAKSALQAAGPELIAATAEALADLLSEPQDEPLEVRWTNEFAPLFTALWPSDKHAQTNHASLSLAKFAVSAGDQFPDALDLITPYLRSLDEDWPHFYFLVNDHALPTVAKFPWHTLALVWCLMRPAHRGQSRELGEVLDRIAQADPSIVRDRRYQLLLDRVMHIG